MINLLKGMSSARPVHTLESADTIQLITVDEERLQKFPGRRNIMESAMLFNGVLYACLLGVLAMAWGWLQRSDS
jgi:tetrahydromethanopterin S-methyltransferase subunit B